MGVILRELTRVRRYLYPYFVSRRASLGNKWPTWSTSNKPAQRDPPLRATSQTQQLSRIALAALLLTLGHYGWNPDETGHKTLPGQDSEMDTSLSNDD